MSCEILKLPAVTGPATHALVIGVSQYRHFRGGESPSGLGNEWGLQQLTAAAASASRVARWLATDYCNPRAPLQTLRVLLSPSDADAVEPSIAARLQSDAHRATRANVEAALVELVRDSGSNRDNVVFVYVAGHGVQLTKHDAIVLLEDVASPNHLEPLTGAIDVPKCHRGFEHDGAPATQFWFVDACRQPPAVAEQFETMTGALGMARRHGKVVASPLYLASSAGELAWANKGKVTLFGAALLEALGGGAAVGPDPKRSAAWHVSAFSLNERLIESVGELARASGVEQNVEPGGRMANALLHELPAPPRCELTVTLRPEEASAVTRASLKQDARWEVPVPPRWPLTVTVEAGLYLLEVETAAPYRAEPTLLQLLPPSHDHALEVDR